MRPGAKKIDRSPVGRRPASRKKAAEPRRRGRPTDLIPKDADSLDLVLDGRPLRLTNLQKVFWPDDGITKGDLLRYYAQVAPVLIPHLKNRAMVMKRYPNGIEGKFFFMKRAPSPRPDWIEVCAIRHGSGNKIEFPLVQDLASLLWVVNLGCIDLNQWYAPCDDPDRPDVLRFDLDPVDGTPFATVREVALRVRAGLEALRMPALAKTTGSRGIHIYVPIRRTVTQKQVWSFAKGFALSMARLFPDLVTSEYRIARRPKGRILVDYNQNA
jgi:bifunctional non-homologous end joining protein LigD